MDNGYGHVINSDSQMRFKLYNYQISQKDTMDFAFMVYELFSFIRELLEIQYYSIPMISQHNYEGLV